MQVKIYNNFTEELKLFWNEIQIQSNNYLFQDLLWLKRWSELNEDILLHIVLICDDKGPAIIFPFGFKKFYGIKLLQFLGGDVSDYQGPVLRENVVENEKFISNAWQAALKSLPLHDVMHLRKLPEFYGGKINFFVKQAEFCFIGLAFSADLPASFDAYEGRLRSSFRLDTKRRRRRLCELGEIKFSVINSYSDEWDAQIEHLIVQKKIRLKEKFARDIFLNNANYQFYKTKFFFEEPNSVLTLATLKLDDEIIALHWGALYKKRFYWLIPSFKAGKWSFYSPGRLLLYELIEWCIKNECNHFDFTIGGEEYKKEWCNSEMKTYQLLKSKSLKGKFYVLIYRIITFLKSKKYFKKYYLIFISSYHNFINARHRN